MKKRPAKRPDLPRPRQVWFQNSRGNWTATVNGLRCVVFQKEGRWHFGRFTLDGARKFYGPIGYDTDDEAKNAALNMLNTPRFHGGKFQHQMRPV